MRLASFITLLAFLAAPPVGAADSATILKDPFRRLERITFANGLQIYFAPSDESTLTAIKIAVDTGTVVEDRSNWGVAHLLEHVLFRDKELKDEMSYLQLIKEAGGNANGSTSEYETNYFGSIPATKGAWLFSQFTRLILNPEIRPEYVAKEKSTVEIERGRPGAVTQLLGYDPRDILNPRYLSMPTFLESEFGVSNEDGFTLAQEQLSTQRLTQKQVQDFYNDYYCPANMRVFISGKYDQAEMKRIIAEKWAVLPARDCKKLPDIPKPKPRNGPYVRMRVTEDTPWVQIGTKVWDTASRDESVIDSYMEYLAHRLMKDMRNKRGQAYSINAQTSIVHRYGYSVLEFNTQEENLNENFELVKRMIHLEATNGGLTPEQVRESIGLYLAAYDLGGKEAWQMMAMSERMRDDFRDYGKFESPYLQLSNITPQEYNEALKIYFQPERSYLSLLKPPLFFPYDSLALWVLIAAGTFFLLKKTLTKPFSHDRIRWVRKLKYPPVKILEGLVFLLAWYVFAHIYFAGMIALTEVPALQSHILTSVYLQIALTVISGLVVLQGFLSVVPRKLMIADGRLIVKSLSYYSFSIPLSDIESVEQRRMLSYPFPLRLWLGRVRWRFYFFNPLFWQKGTLIHLRDGRSYYFSVSDFPRSELDQVQAQHDGVRVARH